MRRLLASIDGPQVVVSVRDGLLRTVGRGVGRVEVEIDDGAHLVAATLPSGRIVQHVLAAGGLDQRVVLDGSPRPLGAQERAIASVELAEGRGSLDVSAEGLVTVSPSDAQPGVLVVRSPGESVPWIVRLPRSERWGATVSLRQWDGQVQCTAITSDPRFSTAMTYRSAGLVRQAAELFSAHDLRLLREECADEPVAVAHLAHLTRHVLDEEHLFWLADQALRIPNDVDVAVAAADLAMRCGEEELCSRLLSAVDGGRRPLFTATAFVAVHLGRRLVAEQRVDPADDRPGASDPYGNRGPRSAPLPFGRPIDTIALMLRGWTSLARRADPDAPTLTLRSTSSSVTSETPAVEVELSPSDSFPEHWTPGRTTSVRRSLVPMFARQDMPETLLASAADAMAAADLDDMRRATERLAEEVVSIGHESLSVLSRTSRRALLDVLDDTARTFPLVAATADRAHREVRGLAGADEAGVEVDLRTAERRVVTIPPFALLLTTAESSTEIEVEVPYRSEDAYRTRIVVPLDLSIDGVDLGRWWCPSGSGATEHGPGFRLTLQNTSRPRLTVRIVEAAIALQDVARVPVDEIERSVSALDTVGASLVSRARFGRVSPGGSTATAMARRRSDAGGSPMDDPADPHVTVALVDAHRAIRDGVVSWFDHADPPIDVLVADDRISAVWHPPGSDADVVVLELHLTQTRGQEFRALRALVDGGRRVVVYTQDLSRDTAVRCIDIGALAFVTKSESKDHLVAAVRAAAGGWSYIPPTLSGSMLADDAPERPLLTAQESAALRAWFNSSSKTLAAAQLGISPKALDTYIGRARVRYANVGRPARTKSELAARALEDGLIELDDLASRPEE